MIFVEGLRLLVVLAGALGGYELASHLFRGPNALVIGLLLGAAVSYVVGGVAGRFADRGIHKAVFLFRNTPPGEVFAASIMTTTGVLLGLVLCLPLLVVLRPAWALLVMATVAWVAGALAWRIGAAKGRQIVSALGLARILGPRRPPPRTLALVVDASALMDRQLLALAKLDLVPGGILVPSVVMDQLRTLERSPDPVAARRARRGLETMDALRVLGVEVNLAPDELPEVDDVTDKILTLARRVGLRIGTCSSHIVALADQWDVRVIDLRDIAGELSPDHVPGERLRVELLRPGRQPRQAVGYLPDGDMVVVNDAVHVIGHGAVPVRVLSSRPTSQGIMVFARLDTDSDPDDGEGATDAGPARRPGTVPIPPDARTATPP
jgi:uncharacterized protein YacL